jgi:hypothetical protein
MSKITNNKKLMFALGVVFGIVAFVGVAVLCGFVITEIYNDINDDANNFDEITYNVPDKFDNDKYDYLRSMSYSENDLYCYIDIESYEKGYYRDAKKVIENNVHFDLKDEVSDLEEFSVSGRKAYKINIKSMGDLYLENTSYYSIDSTNFVYLIKYTIYDYKKGDREDLNTNICYTSKDTFIKSIQVK